MVKIKNRVATKQERVVEASRVFGILGIAVVKKNQGFHWLFSFRGEEVEYWPSTGKWYIPGKGLRSVYNTRFLAGLLKTLDIKYKTV